MTSSWAHLHKGIPEPVGGVRLEAHGTLHMGAVQGQAGSVLGSAGVQSKGRVSRGRFTKWLAGLCKDGSLQMGKESTEYVVHCCCCGRTASIMCA